VGHLRKLIVSDYLSHREVGSILHNTLKEVLASPVQLCTSRKPRASKYLE
jgi:hypothetical protein